MAEKLTIWQRLSSAFGPNSLLNQDYPTYSFDKKELLRTPSKAEYEKEKLQAQQSRYLSGQWTKIENNLYTQATYYEPTRLAAFYDFESMEQSIVGDTKIPTLTGFVTIKELAEKGKDYEFITYAYDHNTKQVVPALARNAHYTRDEMTYKIIFDDDSYIIATAEHRFLKRDGVFCEVKDLQIKDSMMPFYRKSFYNNHNYNWVYSCNSSVGHHGWVVEHTMIAEWFNDTKLKENEVVHHKNFNGKNNLPENLQIMDKTEHHAYHARINNEKLWANPEYRAKMSEVGRRKGKMHWNGKRVGKNNPAYIPVSFDLIIQNAHIYKLQEEVAKSLEISIFKLQDEIKMYGYENWKDLLFKNNIQLDRKDPDLRKIPWEILIESARKCKTIKSTANHLGISSGKLRTTLNSNGYKQWTIFMDAYGLTHGGKGGRKKSVQQEENIVNHKIKSIEPYGIVPVYDLTVPGYKNFATDTIFSHNTPEISAALDIYAEESTTVDENGFMLQIYSESKRIKSILTELFNNILDINTNLPAWTRNTCKYGNNFIYLKLDPEKGIVGCFQLPNIEIERLERGMKGKYQPTIDQTANIDPNDVALKFTWKHKDLEFNTWEVAHFRILGDDRIMPYGLSMLEKARRIWKQLLLSEDAMLIYRTSRAPERRVFKVFVGNMDDQDIEPYVQRVANKFKRDQVVDHKSGNVDMRFNQMAVDQDYFVPVRDMNSPSPIETLPGAQNLSEIADIEYIQKKLLTALRIPKAFLGFEETVGDGKNLSLQDIRFARTINRIQKAMIQELNKVAIIHLFLLGFEDELDNFVLALTNPSTQADLLKIDLWKEKIALYRDAVTDPGNGIQAVSSSWAKKHILGMSDEEIKLDMQQQRIEIAVGAELKLTPNIITHTGLFDTIDKLYGGGTSGTTEASSAPPEPPSPGGGGGGSLSSSILGGDDTGGGEIGGETPPGGETGAPGEAGGASGGIGGETPPGGETGAPGEAGNESEGTTPPTGNEKPGVKPESTEDSANIITENKTMFKKEDDMVNLSKGKKSLEDMESELRRLLDK